MWIEKLNTIYNKKEDWLKETYPYFLEWLENRKNMPKEYQYQDPIAYNCACEGVDMVFKK